MNKYELTVVVNAKIEDDVRVATVEKVKEFMDGLVENIQMSHPEFITEIVTLKVFSNELDAKMKEATGAYVDQFLKTQGAN